MEKYNYDDERFGKTGARYAFLPLSLNLIIKKSASKALQE